MKFYRERKRSNVIIFFQILLRKDIHKMFSFRKSEKMFNWIDEEYPCITDAFYFSLTYQSSQSASSPRIVTMVLTAPVKCLFCTTSPSGKLILLMAVLNLRNLFFRSKMSLKQHFLVLIALILS